ncbi:uncharacterized protein LTR77_005525 [Saxophila tyrrhenica]|uniref:Uncharacterized protein n=1 Tax=Saxophila tyrrhenica TaxID=1690608 RepID=A0AAV9PBQ8_9PEZI|nr:hypothetical protein LTR77_005525 [Saxophila tyrrhenica]
MAETPPPRSVRAATPPTPLHGARYDTYEPYSPRRSTRSTAHSNPYSSFNSDRSPRDHHQQGNTTPPATVKKARFARAPTQLSSPPSSPSSPVKRLRTTPGTSSAHKTPRKQSFTPRKAANHHSDSDTCAPSSSKAATLAPNPVDPTTMLPTPSKTPNKKRAGALASTARILSFQPNHPNDVMPSPHKMKKQSRAAEFDLYEEDAQQGEEIPIYTDANARVPEMDESMDNPFVGPKQGRRPQGGSGSRRTRKSEEEQVREERMQEAVARDEGVVYVFRGRKIFRRFTPPNTQEDDTNDPTPTPNRQLMRSAGATAQRPFTRSAIKPRLLFPSEEQQREREQAANEVDEEALTDIEMADASTVITPPPTATSKRRAGTPKKRSPKGMQIVEEVEEGANGDELDDVPEPMSVGSEPSFASGAGGKGRASAMGKSPFDTWARTKSGKKRGSEQLDVDEGMGKRTRSSGPVGEGGKV